MTKIDPANHQIGQKTEKLIPTTGEARVIEKVKVSEVDGPKVFELEKFMNDQLEILVYEPMEPGEEKVIYLGANGVSQYVIRGRPQIVKRMFVESLARSRRVSLSTSAYKAPNGEAHNSVQFQSGLNYPFQVLHDPSPDGLPWLQKILAENN